jgi:hypothetical protein
MSEESWFNSQQELGISPFSKAARPAMGPTQPSINGYHGSLEVKQPRCEADYSALPTVQVKNE